MNKIISLFICSSFLFLSFACQQGTNEYQIRNGKWRAVLQTPGGGLPFHLTIQKSQENELEVSLLNGEESISLPNTTISGDTIKFWMHIFDAEIIARIISDSVLRGTWHNYARGNDYQVPFSAEFNRNFRFSKNAKETDKIISGNWETNFSPGDSANQTKAIGRFLQSGTKVGATFLTSTGDYRYLEGDISNDSLFLSCFDGYHAFLFKAAIGDTLRGMFWSGNHWQEPWMAVRNESYQLPNPDTLTFLKDGYEKFSFSFPDRKGNLIGLQDPHYLNKVVIVQIMGTWCPNCMDETAFLAEFYKNNRAIGIEMIALAFERTNDTAKAYANIERLNKRYQIDYPILLAGTSSKSEASSVFPMLNQVLAYPTTIFIDRKGKVRRIYTGFFGPATGKDFLDWETDFKAFVMALSQE